ncbi:MAG: RNA methyltransferase [Opitutaceae bacterium]
MNRKLEVAVCGYKSVAAVFARHPESVLRFFYLESAAKQAGPFCRELARARKPYRMVPADELERIGGTGHHGGLVAITARSIPARVEPEDLDVWARVGKPVLVLDRVSNHHNLGALVRSAAFFGIQHVVLGEHRDQAMPGESTYRVAEGGMEYVTFYLSRNLPVVLEAARSKFLTVATVVRGRSSSPGAVPRRRGRPWMLVLGNEETGISHAVTAACEFHVSIPGSGQIESLNVSATGAIMMAWASMPAESEAAHRSIGHG